MKCRFRQYALVLMIAILCFSLCAVPLVAAERVIYSEPLLTVSLAGDNTFYPGEERELQVLISNAGVVHEAVDPAIPSVHDTNPLTARGVSVRLNTTGMPFTLKTGGFMVGDIPPGEERSIGVLVQADEDAPAGPYECELAAVYSYMDWTTLYGDEIAFSYKNASATGAVPLRVKSTVRPEIIAVETENLAAGHTGTITITFRNIGYGTGEQTAADLVMNASTLRLVEGGNYFGRIEPQGMYTVSLKASVEKDAPDGVIPAGFVIRYSDEDGVLSSSEPVSVGIPVDKGPLFQIVSTPPVFRPGDTKDISVTFRNTGDATAYGAKVRVTAMAPFSAETPGAILGDIGPGEEETASLRFSLDRSATIRPYGLTAVLRYYDEAGNLILADPMEVEIHTTAENPMKALVTSPVFIVCALGCLVLGLYFFKFRD